MVALELVLASWSLRMKRGQLLMVQFSDIDADGAKPTRVRSEMIAQGGVH